MSNYWPWWAGALGLALATINYTLATDRSFGVSGAWDRVLHWRKERELQRQRAQDDIDQRSLVEALAAISPGSPAPSSPTSKHERPENPPVHQPPRPAPLASQVALLLSILIGGFVAAVAAGRFELRLDMGAGFSELVTDNSMIMVGVLFLGGLLVGFGTRLAGGCSSGHGLHGCGRLCPVSIVATAVFFGTAVLVSFLLWKVI
jgi:Predicted transporter component